MNNYICKLFPQKKKKIEKENLGNCKIGNSIFYNDEYVNDSIKNLIVEIDEDHKKEDIKEENYFVLGNFNIGNSLFYYDENKNDDDDDDDDPINNLIIEIANMIKNSEMKRNYF